MFLFSIGIPIIKIRSRPSDLYNWTPIPMKDSLHIEMELCLYYKVNTAAEDILAFAPGPLFTKIKLLRGIVIPVINFRQSDNHLGFPRVNSVLHGHPWSILLLTQCCFSFDNFTKISEITIKSSEITVRGIYHSWVWKEIMGIPIAIRQCLLYE